MASRATAVEARTAPPERGEDDGHSGRLLLRMPQSLHGELARAAEREHVSLNAYIIAALSATVRWRSDEEAGTTRREAGGMPRLLRIAIIADVVLVAVAACVAVVLLIAAL
jgi:hypothetical protein